MRWLEFFSLPIEGRAWYAMLLVVRDGSSGMAVASPAVLVVRPAFKISKDGTKHDMCTQPAPNTQMVNAVNKKEEPATVSTPPNPCGGTSSYVSPRKSTSTPSHRRGPRVDGARQEQLQVTIRHRRRRSETRTTTNDPQNRIASFALRKRALPSGFP